ncbi:hypothetical protein Golax_022704 [Gossypium laxum]|uniref:Uncharacterized protein n=1 Tax=Gossypium laxum TaxID=34288 RepID=A0A7J9B5B1_9ROSI|nr:hypothetical protein [Gossypium laxum]
MERELAALSLNNEEDDIVEVQRQVELAVNENEFWLVGCFLMASVIHFPFMKNGFGAGFYEASWMFNNHLLVFHQLFLRDDPLKVPFEKKEEANVCNWKLCICARMALGVEVVKMGWDLTLKAQFSWATEERIDSGIRIDPVLRLNLEGDQTIMSLHKNDPSKPLGLMAMEHDLEKLILDGWDGQKRPRRDLSEYSQGVEFRSLGMTDGKVLEIFLYRQLPRGIQIGRNENDKLKCLRVGKPSTYAKTSVYAEVA